MRVSFRPTLETLDDRLLLAALTEPPALTSTDGVLKATLAEIEGSSLIDGQSVTNAKTYNGIYAGVTLKARPGDLLDLTLVNLLKDKQTNLHTHGLHVSPIGNGDNPLLSIDPGASQRYQIQLPSDHPQGMYWYHPHEHGQVDDQLRMGLSGMLVVGRADGGAPELNGYKQVLLGLKSLTTSAGVPLFTGLSTTAHYAVNGQIKPTMTMAPGEIQVWNVANLSLETNFRLQLDGHALHLVTQDGNPMTRVRTVDFIDVVPGARVSFLVQGSTTPGTYTFRTLGFLNGFNASAAEELTTVEISGTVQASTLPTTLTPPASYTKDLTTLPLAAQRTIVFSEDKEQAAYYVNGQSFPNAPVIIARLNTVEEWTILNDTYELHPFHIHQNGFQVISVNGTAIPADGTPVVIDSVARVVAGFSDSSVTGYAPQSQRFVGGSFVDTVTVPTKNPTTGEPGRVVLRMRYEDFLGTFVYHCHIPFHEDNGMMGVVQVVPEAPTYALGANSGTFPRVQVFNPVDNSLVGDFLAFERSYRGGVSVAVADVNGDGVNDVIAGRMTLRSEVKVFDGTRLGQVNPVTGELPVSALLGRFLAFGPQVRVGVHVTAGYHNGDARADIIVGAAAGWLPRIRVIDATKLSQIDRNRTILSTAVLQDFLAFGAHFRGGVRVTAGDVDFDGCLNIIAGAGPGAPPHVKVFCCTDAHLCCNFLAFGTNFRGGVYVATGFVKGYGYLDVIVGAGAGGSPLVKVYSSQGTDTTSHGHSSLVAHSPHEDHGGSHGMGECELVQVDAFLAYARKVRTGVKVSALLDPRLVLPYGTSRHAILATLATGNGLGRTVIRRTITA